MMSLRNRQRIADKYAEWIAANVPADCKGLCVPTTKAMAAAFPELYRVRGFYTCPLDGRRAHWWLKTSDGTIVDPTVRQFQSNGYGEYEEYSGPEPTGHCLNCGELLFNGATFCHAQCAKETMEFMKAGGSIFVNGTEIGA